MLRATLKNLLAHKLRMALTTLSVVLGVAFVTGTMVLTDTMNATFTALTGEANEGTDVAVQAEQSFSTGDGTNQRQSVPVDMVAEVSAVDGVAEAAGYVEGYAAVQGDDGEVVANGWAPQLGASWIDSEALSPFNTRDGRGPERAGEVAVDVDTAEAAGLEVGDRVTVLLQGPAQEAELVGIFSFGESNALGGATMTAFASDVAPSLLSADGGLTRVVARAEAGVSEDDLAARVKDTLPSGLEALTGEQIAQNDAANIQEGLSFFSYFLLTFAVIALFVGSFIIFNTFSMLVAQRTRELGLLRAVGASRGQIRRTVLLEALAIGLVGSVVGLAAGVGVSRLLQVLLDATGASLPTGDMAFETSTVVWAFAVGVGVTLVAALLPARRAGKISPVAAISEHTRTESGSLRRRLAVGVLFSTVGVGLLATGLTDSADPPVLFVGLGVAAVFLGVTTLSPFISRPVIRVLALPLPHTHGTPGRLSRDNALRNPRRTSATAGALMIGLALVSTFTVMGASLKESFGAAIEKSFGADYLLGTENFMPVSTDLAKRVAEVDGVEEVGTIRWGVAKFGEGDGKDWLSAVQPEVLDELMTVDMVEGSASALGDGQLLVARSIAENEGWTVGQELPAEFAATGTSTIVLGGVYEPNAMAGDYLISTAVYDQNFTNKVDSGVMLRFGDGADVEAATRSIEQVLTAFPNVDLMDMQEFTAVQQGFVDNILALVTALLGLAVLIAMFGIMNTLALAVFERTHEIGLLRAVGMSRRQLRRMVRLESVIISTFGAVLGLALGAGFGWAIVSALSDIGVTELVVPVPDLLRYVAVGASIGVLAAWWPARRASKMNVLGAIATT